ncbi:glycosyltransferase [Phenylobacterium sp.]|uniref:glycosyltransferase n=1 Tax=Phenylobacterium sp. TaxID=1871053 RepID=UPI00289883F0|nr:glycosyltransferase [Phenylobacterium sp.]
MVCERAKLSLQLSSDGEASERVDVSVLLITYNHADYIAKSLDGVLAQNTDKTVELIVSEDCSTDATPTILAGYLERHPQIRVLASPENLRSNEVVARAIRAARGRYICLLDGDDYWTDPGKIQRQADMLDADPALAAVFHNALIDDGMGAPSRRWTPAEQKAVSGRDDLWDGNPFATCAGMLRREALSDLGAWYADFFPITDWPLYILCAAKGPIAFVDEPVGGYRLHAGGMFSSLPGGEKLDRTEGFYRRMRAVVPPSQRRAASAGASRYFFDWAEVYAQRGEIGMARDCLRRALRAGGVSQLGVRRFLRAARNAWLAGERR